MMARLNRILWIGCICAGANIVSACGGGGSPGTVGPNPPATSIPIRSATPTPAPATPTPATPAPATPTPAAGILSIGAASYSVAQNAGSIAIRVTRNGGSNGQASADYATADGTALRGRDYTQITGILTWAARDRSTKAVSIPISNASPFNGTRTFTFSLSHPSGATLGTSSASVTIAGDAHQSASCPRGNAYADGCAGATQSGTAIANFFTGFTGTTYPVRPPWNVAGVDYPVGLPSGTKLADPSTAALPAGCSYSSLSVSCSGNNITVKGYDFSLHGGIKLMISGSGNAVSGNKFAVAPNCADPLLRYSVNAGASLLISKNTFDGGGAACTSFVFGTSLFGEAGNGSATTIEYNYFLNTPDDVSDAGGPANGAASFTYDYNLFDNDGWRAHPDGSQFNGGNFNPIKIEFNTFVTSYAVTGYQTQPFHVEAQLTAALANSSVAYNTMAALGACHGGAGYPVGCSANYMIACKQDAGANSNVNFTAYGNYIDATGAIAALINSYGCPSTTWGSPIPNYDLTTGLPLPVP